MSKRPTTKYRQKACHTNNINNYDYAIIGDTVGTIIYAKRLLANGVTSKINLIFEGMDKVNDNDIRNIDFPVDHAKTILHFLLTEQIHLISAGDHDYDNENGTLENDIVFQHFVGAGPLGNFIANYFTAHLGPWFSHHTNTRLERFFHDNTQKMCLNSAEVAVNNSLSTQWNIPLTSSLIVRYPSILNTHYKFTRNVDNVDFRELFLDIYHNINQASNVDLYTEVGQLKITPGTISGLYNITNDNGVNIQNAKIVWKTNPYTYLRIATNGGLNPGPLYLPTFYRSVLSIPLNNISTGGVDLSNLDVQDDLLTTHIALSLYDIHNPQNSGLTWLLQAYTTTEDLSVVAPQGKYADTGNTLLIIEGLCTKNRRRTIYDSGEDEVQVRYNDIIAEYGYKKQFAQIIISIYKAYTGITIPIDTIISDISVCFNSGYCQDNSYLQDYSLRASPMMNVLDTASQLYGTGLFTDFGKC